MMDIKNATLSKSKFPGLLAYCNETLWTSAIDSIHSYQLNLTDNCIAVGFQKGNM